MKFIVWIARALLIVLLVRLVLRLLFGRAFRVPPGAAGRMAPGGRPGETPPSKAGGELVRDPQCGTYVPRARALAASVGHETRYFCSQACRDAYFSKAHA